MFYLFNFFRNHKTIKLKAPLTGKVLRLSEIPDEVFSKRVIGDGVAIRPTEGKLVSPVEGVIKYISPTKHAIAIKTEKDIEILVHIGINTVKLEGTGFKQRVKQGDRVNLGDELITFNLDYIRQEAVSSITPILVVDVDRLKKIEIANTSNVKKGVDELLKISLRN